VAFLPYLPRATRQARSGSDSRLGLYGVLDSIDPFPVKATIALRKSRCPEASPNFVMTEFSEVHSESALGAKTALGIGASLVAAFLLDLRFGALRVEAQAG
jgi:hypothetical protein